MMKWITRCALLASILLVANGSRDLSRDGFDFPSETGTLDWVGGYSMIFQGCSHVDRYWNAEANSDNDVRLKTKRLVYFRLCPEDTCSDSLCTQDYGNYVVDIETYLTAYFEGVSADDTEFDHPVQYAACRPAKHVNNDNNNDEKEYYIGPYCAAQGGEIRVGLFTDNTCSIFADDYDGGKRVYSELTQEKLPYSETSLVDPSDCLTCRKKEPTRKLGWYHDELSKFRGSQKDETTTRVNAMCRDLYTSAGKCEEHMNVHQGQTDVTSLDTSACTYMQGTKIMRISEIFHLKSHASPVATIAIFVLAGVFGVLVVRVYHLRQKVDANSPESYYRDNGYDVIPAAETEAFL